MYQVLCSIWTHGTSSSLLLHSQLNECCIFKCIKYNSIYMWTILGGVFLKPSMFSFGAEQMRYKTEGQRAENKYAKRTKKQRRCTKHTQAHTHTHIENVLFSTHSLSHSLCHPVSALARKLASTRAGRCSKTSYYFVPALLYPSGCAFKFPHLLLFTLSSSRAGTLSKIHTCTHAHAQVLSLC